MAGNRTKKSQCNLALHPTNSNGRPSVLGAKKSKNYSINHGWKQIGLKVRIKVRKSWCKIGFSGSTVDDVERPLKRQRRKKVIFDNSYR